MSRRSLVVGVVTLLLSSVLLAADYPQWRGPERDGKVPIELPATWPESLKTMWTASVGLGDAGALVVGDRVYTFGRRDSEEVIACIDASSGEERWKYAYDVPAINGPDARQHAGPRATPAVADGRLVAIGVTGIVSCVDAASGQLVWKKDDIKGVPKFHTASSPLIVGDLCIAQLGSADSGGIFAFAMDTGDVKWQWSGEGPDYASPVLSEAGGTRQIVTLTAKQVVGVSLNEGKLLWSAPFLSEGRNYNAATPIVDGDTAFIAGQGRGVKALKLEEQSDGFTTKELWAKPDVAVQYSSPVLIDQSLYGLSDKGMIFCLNAETGELRWSDATRRGGYGPIVTDGKSILMLTEKGELLVFAADAKEFRQLASYQVSPGATYATPAITASDAIYIKTQDSLVRMSAK